MNWAILSEFPNPGVRRTGSETENWWLMIRVTLVFICLAAISSSASAQNSPTRSPTFGSSAGAEILRHRSPTGAPCLAVVGSPRRHTVNPNLYDHVITVKNSCAQRIAIRVCYYRTQECISIEVPGNEPKEAVLGTMPSVADFRFEFHEKF